MCDRSAVVQGSGTKKIDTATQQCKDICTARLGSGVSEPGDPPRSPTNNFAGDNWIPGFEKRSLCEHEHIILQPVIAAAWTSQTR